MFRTALIAAMVSTIVAEVKARQAWLNSLPVDVADNIRAEDARIAREDEQHRRALEIAEAGRPRNFWGR